MAKGKINPLKLFKNGGYKVYSNNSRSVISSVVRSAPEAGSAISSSVVKSTPEAGSAISSSVVKSAPEADSAISSSVVKSTPEAGSAISSSVIKSTPEAGSAISSSVVKSTPEAGSAISSSVKPLGFWQTGRADMAINNAKNMGKSSQDIFEQLTEMGLSPSQAKERMALFKLAI